MKLFEFLTYMKRDFSRVLYLNVIVLLVVGTVEAFSVFSITPLIDIFLGKGAKEYSEISGVIDSGLKIVGLTPSFFTYAALFLIITSLKSLLVVVSRWVANKTKYDVVSSVLERLVFSLFGASWKIVGVEKKGYIINTVMREMSNIGDGFSTLVSMLNSVIRLIFYLLIPIIISWKLALFAMGLVSVVFVPMKILNSISYKWGKETTETANRFSETLHESLQGLKTIAAFGRTRRYGDILMRLFNRHKNAATKSLTFSESIPLAYEPIILLILVLIVGMAKQNALATTSEILIALYAYRISLPLCSNIIADVGNINRFYTGFRQIHDITLNAEKNPQKSGEKEFVKLEDKVEFQNVEFSHIGGAFFLKNINLEIHKGELIALTGPSGCGKSTILDLLMGFLQPHKGKILLDESEIQDFSIFSLRRKVGYVPQENIFFNMSIRDNLTWPYDDISDEEIWEALEKTNCTEFMVNTSRSLDDTMGEGGTNFSGGQRQRLAIARALLGSPEVLILDEVTSNLDLANEELISDFIEKVKGELTIIAVTHRLSVMKVANRICYMENGEILERGSCHDLMNKRGAFYRKFQRKIEEDTSHYSQKPFGTIVKD